MTLYLKAAADGTLVGDCPFAHAVRMVLNEKGLEYELRPSTQETKPRWLIEHYEGKMPALRHRKECYVESEVICQYLEFFFPQPSLTPDKTAAAKANEAVDGFFPALARYLKHTPDGDEQDEELKQSLEAALQKLEDHLSDLYLCGEKLSLQDCALAPKLYHLKTGIKAFKNNAIDLQQQFPKVSNYMDKVFARQSFTDALYPEDVVVWGWGNARK
jgi:glutathione S-transferase